MSTLREITDGTGYQNGSEPTRSARYWTYRGETVASPGEDDQSYEAINLNRALYVWFEYTGTDVAGARQLVNDHFAAVAAADGTPNSSPRTTLTATNNAFRERFAVTNSVSNVGQLGSMQAFPVRGGDTVASTHIVFALVTDLNVTTAAGQRAFFQQNLLSIAEINLSNYIFTTNVGGWEDFNFTLPTTFTSDVNITQLADANQPEPRALAISSAGKVVLGDNTPVFNGVYTARSGPFVPISVGASFSPTAWEDVFDSSMTISGFDWLVGQRGYAFLVPVADASTFDGSRRLAEVVCDQADDGSNRLSFRVVQVLENQDTSDANLFNPSGGGNDVIVVPFDPRPLLPGTAGSDDFVVSGMVSGTDLILTRSEGGTVTINGLPSGSSIDVFGRTVGMAASHEVTTADLNRLTFDTDHFVLSETSAGQISILASSGAPGTLTVQNSGVILGSAVDQLNFTPGIRATQDGGSNTDVAITTRQISDRVSDSGQAVFEVFTHVVLSAPPNEMRGASYSLPAVAGLVDGDEITIVNNGTQTITVGRNGARIEGAESDLILMGGDKVVMRYATDGFRNNLAVASWQIVSRSISLNIYTHDQTAIGTSTTWTITHGLNSLRPTVTVYDNTNNVILPMTIVASEVNSQNTITITFPVAVDGYATLVG